jgi:hypothetical protein
MDKTLISHAFQIDWNSLISALIGGVLSLLGAVGAVLIDRKISREEEESKERILLRGFINSIKTEMTTLWDDNSHLESLREGEPFLTTIAITQDYFVIYSNNSHLIGRLKSEELRNHIVKTYTAARMLIDVFAYNNDLVREMRDLEYKSVHSGSSNLSNHIKMKRYELVEWAPEIIKNYTQTKNDIKKLSILVEQYED